MQPNTKQAVVQKFTKTTVDTGGEALKRLIANSYLRVSHVAEGCGLSTSTLYKIMSGVTNITDYTATKLGAFFGNGKAFWFRKQYHLDELFLAIKPLTAYASAPCRFEKRTVKMITSYLAIFRKTKRVLRCSLVAKLAPKIRLNIVTALCTVLV